ncbi:DnaB Replicative DNA helicase [uncultured Caudovirales phage]|uniref:DNA 5'-3' helicase n=1 Tax=uncultured Caudovirales phage TaxID=2100421 RepID=A0A6J5MEH9_9CAUD|nr:DnaB Replicative DNA helicase [uncultured Caudovirales phage]CAB4189673.1 DnaB Replicative DNA helicase [uncultured Caudovirales phage]
MPDDPLEGLSQRQWPASIQAEQALLGAILANNKAHDLCGFLRPEHFADAVHASLFTEIRRLIEGGRLADAVTLKATLENAGTLDAAGGTAYLAQLLTAMVSVINAGEYARVIHDAWVRRQVIQIGAEVVSAAFGSDGEAKDGGTVIAEAVDRLLEVGAGGSDGGSSPDESLSDTLDAVLDASDRAAKGERGSGGLMTGIVTLDALWSGLHPGMLDILGARSEHGKTALGMQIATAIARGLLEQAEATKQPPEHVLVFSLEMSRKDIGTRMMASETGVSADAIRNGRLTEANAAALVGARAHLRSLPILIRDKKGMSQSDIRIEALTLQRRKMVRFIVIDHLHRIKPDRAVAKQDRLQQVRHTTEALKDLAGMLNVPILLLAQLTRDTDRRDTPRPRVSDIQYAGEADADNVVLLWRPELYSGTTPPDVPGAKFSAEKRAEVAAQWREKQDQMKGRAEIIFAKRRFGPTGAVWLTFDGPRTRFADVPEQDWREQTEFSGWQT